MAPSGSAPGTDVPGSESIEPRNPIADRRALEELADACDSFSPIVGVEDAERPECLFLDITGLEPLFGDELAIVAAVARLLDERGLDARLAVADTPGAAWAVAHYAGNAAIVPGVVVPPGGSRDALSPLRVAALRLTDETIDVLAELGVRRVGELLALPRESLASRFDPRLIERMDQALGLVPETLLAHRPPPAVVVERRLEYPLEERRQIERVIEQSLEKVAAALAVRQQGIVKLQCQLCCESLVGRRPAEPLGFVVGLYRPSAAPGHLLELVKMRLERACLPGPVVALRLAVLIAARLEARQQELFANPRDDPRRLTLLVDRLSGRLDRQAVLQTRLVADAQPELACRLEPLAGNSPGGSRGEKNKMPGKQARGKKRDTEPAVAACRPLWLEPRPVAVEVWSVAPEGPPQRFCFRGRQYTIRGSWGPERIQTGWWRGRSIRRDYYRIETDGGQRFWLFRARDGRWFLHGVFD